VVILCLIELGGRALEDKFRTGQIEEIVERFAPTFESLEDLGLVDKTGAGPEDDGALPLWTSGTWTMSTPAVIRWVHDVVIARTRAVRTYDEWLEDERYQLFLPKEQWNFLTRMVRNAVDWALEKGAPLVQLVYQIKGGP
jgi:hypothetical protein